MYYVVVYNNHNKCIVQQKHSLMGQYKINTNMQSNGTITIDIQIN
jgi:hypothetical protein